MWRVIFNLAKDFGVRFGPSHAFLLFCQPCILILKYDFN